MMLLSVLFLAAIVLAGFKDICTSYNWHPYEYAVIARCPGPDGESYCSRMWLSNCYKVEDGRIIPYMNGGFEGITGCDVDVETMVGKCYLNEERTEWAAIRISKSRP